MGVNPQIENGHTDIANEIIDFLCGYRLSGEEWQILLVILRKTYGWHKKSDDISLSQFYFLTRIKKPNIVRAINKLIEKKVIIKKDKGSISNYTFNKDFSGWEALSKKITHNINNIIKKDNDILISSNKINDLDNLNSVIKKDNGDNGVIKIDNSIDNSVIKKDNGVIKKDNESLSKKIHTKESITKETITKEKEKENTIHSFNRDVEFVVEKKEGVNNNLDSYFKKLTKENYIKLLSAKIQILDWEEVFIRFFREVKSDIDKELPIQHLVLWAYKGKNKITNPLSALKVIYGKLQMGELTTNILSKSDLYEQIGEWYDPVYEKMKQEQKERESSQEYKDYVIQYKIDEKKAMDKAEKERKENPVIYNPELMDIFHDLEEKYNRWGGNAVVK